MPFLEYIPLPTLPLSTRNAALNTYIEQLVSDIRGEPANMSRMCWSGPGAQYFGYAWPIQTKTMFRILLGASQQI